MSPGERSDDMHNLIKREDSIGSENSVSHGNYSVFLFSFIFSFGIKVVILLHPKSLSLSLT